MYVVRLGASVTGNMFRDRPPARRFLTQLYAQESGVSAGHTVAASGRTIAPFVISIRIAANTFQLIAMTPLCIVERRATWSTKRLGYNLS